MKKNKDIQQMQGVVMLETDYFADNSTYTVKDFRRRFGMNKELFMKIVIGVREYDDYLHSKKRPPDFLGLPQFRNARLL
jgi:hypothetical protein